MRLIVSDTGPVNYLLLIGHIDILPALFDRVVIPTSVREELSRPKAPSAVRAWISSPPAWLEVIQPPPPTMANDLKGLGPGERDAMVLAATLGADLLLVDEREGVKAALGRGLRTTGTIGLLDQAAQRGLVDLPAAFSRLTDTTFRYPAELLSALLKKHRSTEG